MMTQEDKQWFRDFFTAMMEPQYHHLRDKIKKLNSNLDEIQESIKELKIPQKIPSIPKKTRKKKKKSVPINADLKKLGFK